MFVNLKPMLTDSAMLDLEKHCQRTKHGISRRMLLGILTKTGEELIEAALAAPEAMLGVYEDSAATVAHYRDMGKFMEAAHTRMMLALCAVDTDVPDAPFTKERFSAAISATNEGDSPTD